MKRKDEMNVRCDLCIHCFYDDENDTMECEAGLDEDEMVSFLSRKDFGCPYFQYNDEYKRVRTQN